MDPIKHKPTRHLSFISILSVGTFAIVVALATMIASGGGRDLALEQRWYSLLASGNPQILGTFRTQNLEVDQNLTIAPVSYGQIQYGPTSIGSGQSMLFTTSRPTTTTQLYVQENPVSEGAPHTAYEAINIVADQRVDYDTTLQPSSCNAFTALANCNHVSGSNALTTAAIICAAQAGSGSSDGSYCLYGPAGGGAIRVDDGASFGPTSVASLASGGAVSGTTANFTQGVTLNALGGNTAVDGILTVQSTEKVGDLEFQSLSTINYIYASSTNEPIELSSSGNRAIEINNNQSGTDSGTGGVKIYPGNNSATVTTWFNGNGHEMTGGTAPTFNTCGTGTPACVANSPCTDRAARVTTAATNTGCTVHFATTYTKIPACTCTDETSSTRLTSCVPTATDLVFGLAANSNDVISYSCVSTAVGGT